jgi:flagellar biosynthesis anti-sigma factor FlgM
VSDANRIGETTQVMLPTPVGATGGKPSSANSDQTTLNARHAQPPTIEMTEMASDSAQVSLAGMLISQASKGSDVRFEKVASLRQAIKAGVYRVSSADLADMMMQDLQRPWPGTVAR